MNFILPSILGVIGAIVLALGGWRWLRAGEKRLCPGPALCWSERLLGLWIVYRPRCGYDLAGHAPRSRGGVVCPECGREVRRRQMVRTARAFRPGSLALVLFLMAYLIYRHPPIAGSTVVALTPTNILLRGEAVFGVGTPLEVRDEVRRRAMNSELDDNQLSRLVALLVRDLRDDKLIGNAKDALEKLAIFGNFDDQPLIDALSSDDRQQRRLAADVLRSLSRDGEVPKALLRATIEELRSDAIGWNALEAQGYLAEHVEDAKALLAEALMSDDDQQRDLAKDLLRETSATGDVFMRLLRLSVDDLCSGRGQSRTRRGFQYLVEHAAAAEELLDKGMNSNDPRQRLLCAAVAGCAGRTRLLDRATPILVIHLAENAIENDAVLAARALAGFGAAVAQPLEPSRQRGDEQQRQSVEYIVRRLTTDESPIRLQLKLPLARLTVRQRDALELSIDALRMPQF